MTAPTIDKPKVVEPERPKTQPREEVGGEDMSQFETEMEVACQWGVAAGPKEEPSCDRPATWIIQTVHGLRSCPSEEMFFCDDHAKVVLNYWQQALKTEGLMCRRCMVPITGQISDVLKAFRFKGNT